MPIYDMFLLRNAKESSRNAESLVSTSIQLIFLERMFSMHVPDDNILSSRYREFSKVITLSFPAYMLSSRKQTTKGTWNNIENMIP